MNYRTFFSRTAITVSFASLILPNISFADSSSQDQSTFSLGAGTVIKSKYAGSDKLKSLPLLHMEYDFGNGFFATTTKGIGFNYSHEIQHDISLFGGMALNYEFGRKEKDELKGMGKIKGTLLNTIELGIDFSHYLTLSAGANIPLTERDNGTSYYVSANAHIYHSDSNHIIFTTTAYYFDQKYNQTYFGVTNKQSANSQFSAYKPSAGLSQIDAGFYWTHRLNKDWTILSFAGVSHLLNDAADSPIVKRKTSPLLYLAATYHF